MKKLLFMLVLLGIAGSGYFYYQNNSDDTKGSQTTKERSGTAETIDDSREAVDQSQDRRNNVQTLGEEALTE